MSMCTDLNGAPFTQKIKDKFDILCFDPRGIGQSSPIKCDSRLLGELARMKVVIGKASFDELSRLNTAFGESCLKMSGELPRYMDSVSVAKDIEATSASLGEKLNYPGVSHGTVLGSTYAELFSENIRSMVLDAVLDHGTSPTDLLMTAAEGHENALNQFFVWCEANRHECGFNVKDPTLVFDYLVVSANAKSIPISGCDGARALTDGCETGLSCTNVQQAVVKKLCVSTDSTWRSLSQALEQMMFHNDATAFTKEHAFPVEWTAYRAVLGMDGGSQFQGHDDIRPVLRSAVASTPHLGETALRTPWSFQSFGWPIEAKNPPRPFDSTAMARAPPILIVNSRHDVAMPYQFAESLRAQMPGSLMTTREGNGHGSYHRHGGATELIDRYLLGQGIASDNIVAS